MWTNDPVADARRYYAEQEEKLNELPKCSECGEPIQDDSYFEVGGDYYCEECMDNHRIMNY